MRQTLLVLSSVLTFVSVAPYIRDVWKGTTKPRIVSWIIWTLLMAIAGFASLSAGAIASSVLAFSAAFATALIVVIGYHKSSKDMKLFEVACFCGAMVGLFLWWKFNSPVIAIIASVLIDFVAAIPTLVHSWKMPHEETVALFAISAVGACCSLLAVQQVSFSAIVLPLYLTVINIVFTLIITLRPRFVSQH